MAPLRHRCVSWPHQFTQLTNARFEQRRRNITHETETTCPFIQFCMLLAHKRIQPELRNSKVARDRWPLLVGRRSPVALYPSISRLVAPRSLLQAFGFSIP